MVGCKKQGDRRRPNSNCAAAFAAGIQLDEAPGAPGHEPDLAGRTRRCATTVHLTARIVANSLVARMLIVASEGGDYLSSDESFSMNPTSKILPSMRTRRASISICWSPISTTKFGRALYRTTHPLSQEPGLARIRTVPTPLGVVASRRPLADAFFTCYGSFEEPLKSFPVGAQNRVKRGDILEDGDMLFLSTQFVRT